MFLFFKYCMFLLYYYRPLGSFLYASTGSLPELRTVSRWGFQDRRVVPPPPLRPKSLRTLKEAVGWKPVVEVNLQEQWRNNLLFRQWFNVRGAMNDTESCKAFRPSILPTLDRQEGPFRPVQAKGCFGSSSLLVSS